MRGMRKEERRKEITELVSEKEVAKMFHVSRAKVVMWAQLGVIDFVTVTPNQRRYSSGCVDKFVEEWHGYDMSTETKCKLAMKHKKMTVGERSR